MSAAERFGCLCPLLDVLKHNSSKRAALYRRTILLVVIIILLGEKIQFAAAKQRQWYGVNTIRAAQEEGIQATTELDGKIYALVGELQRILTAVPDLDYCSLILRIFATAAPAFLICSGGSRLVAKPVQTQGLAFEAHLQ